MVFGSEAVLPADIAFWSPRVENYNEELSNEAREDDLNAIEEKRLDTCTRTAKYLEGLRRYYNKNVHERSFSVGDLVLRWKQNKKGLHKTSSHWEGPYRVVEVTRPGSYRLRTMDDIEVPNSQNIEHLRRFYTWQMRKIILYIYCLLKFEWMKHCALLTFIEYHIRV